MLVVEEGGCSGQLLIMALPSASSLTGELTERYLWVLDRVLVGRDVHGCSVKVKVARFRG